MAITECVRIRQQTGMLEEKLWGIKNTNEEKFISAKTVLTLIKDLAPYCSEERLLEFVLEKSEFCKEFSAKDYVSMMYSSETWKMENGVDDHVVDQSSSELRGKKDANK
jgi:hypothetical protein